MADLGRNGKQTKTRATRSLPTCGRFRGAPRAGREMTNETLNLDTTWKQSNYVKVTQKYIRSQIINEIIDMCAPDPHRLQALHYQDEHQWTKTKLNMNHVSGLLFVSGRQSLSLDLTEQSKYMKASIYESSVLGNSYPILLDFRLVYTTLGYSKYFFSDLTFNKKEGTGETALVGITIHPTAAIQIHSSPKWRCMPAHTENLICCKVWVPAGTPLYFHMSGDTTQDYAAMLFAHTLRVTDQYTTIEGGHKVNNIVVTIQVYDADTVDENFSGRVEFFDFTPGNDTGRTHDMKKDDPNQAAKPPQSTPLSPQFFTRLPVNERISDMISGNYNVTIDNEGFHYQKKGALRKVKFNEAKTDSFKGDEHAMLLAMKMARPWIKSGGFVTLNVRRMKHYIRKDMDYELERIVKRSIVKSDVPDAVRQMYDIS